MAQYFRHNLAVGYPSIQKHVHRIQPLVATMEQIEDAARVACVHEDILRLPEGYQTQVGERGVMLSGGQKQRISIARAILQNAEILILDDALSAVDGQTEHTILQNLSRWRQGRTLIISAHRLSALVDADNIIVLCHGSIVAKGTHKVLSQQSGWYSDMYHYQQIEAALDGDL
jgi:ATP-binding cassette, subfamily B, multidrug efflux pump